MSELAHYLEREARRRNLLLHGEDLTAQRAFALIRDMPYKRASSRRPESIVEEWQGTCSGKHYLLAEVLREMGMEVDVMMSPHQFDQENTGHFPEELQEMLADGPVSDVHTFLKVRTGLVWTVVDATWPSSVEPLGMTVNHEFNPGIDMTLACNPLETYRVPPGQDPQQFKEDLIQRFCGTLSWRRDDFIEGMGEWLGGTAAI